MHYVDPLTPDNNKNQETAMHEMSQEPLSINNNKNDNNMAFSMRYFYDIV